MSDKIKEILFKPGDNIIREGLPSSGLFVIKDGYVEVFKTNVKGEKIILSVVRPGEYLGEMSLLGERPHNASAAAISHVRCTKVSASAIESQLKDVPKWLIGMTKGLIARLDRMNEIIKRNKIDDVNLYEMIATIKKNAEN